MVTIGSLVLSFTAFPLPIQVIAHRGARSLAPENTLAAARVAWELGADAWELDIQMTKDGELVVLHDETLDRTTNVADLFPDRGPWRVQDFTLAEIRCLDAGSWFLRDDPFGTIASGEVAREEAEKYKGEPVPTLREALLLTRELGLWVNIELKSSLHILSHRDQEIVEKTVALVRELGLTDRVLISSFNHAMIGYLVKIAPELRGALLMNFLPSDPLAYARFFGAVGINPRITAYHHAQACALREAGLTVYVWTVNEPEDMARLAQDPCVTGIITDWPQRLLATLGRKGEGGERRRKKAP